MKTRNLIKSAGRGLVALALPLGLVGCNLQEYHFFSVPYEENIIVVHDNEYKRELEFKDLAGEIRVKAIDGKELDALLDFERSNGTKVKDGRYDFVEFFNVPKGSEFEKYMDSSELAKVDKFVDTKIEELKTMKVEIK